MSFIKYAIDLNAFTMGALRLRFEQQDARKALLRSILYILLVFLMWLADFHRSVYKGFFMFMMVLLCIINFMGFTCCSLALLFMSPLQGSKQQRSLLGFQENDELFQVVNPQDELNKKRKFENFRISDLSICRMKQKGRPWELPRNSRSAKLKQNSIRITYENMQSPRDVITDEQGLEKYLEDLERESYEEDLWKWQKYAVTNLYYSKLLQTSVYQLSPLPKDERFKSKKNISKNIQNFPKELFENTSLEQVSKGVANLRHWITMTILKPLIAEINDINERLMLNGLAEFVIGKSSLEKLRNLGSCHEFMQQHLPRLPVVLSFLELASNQIHLISRLRCLADGYYLNDYSNTKSSVFNEPNDAAIVFHCFCVYMDIQLADTSLNSLSKERVFYDKYVIINRSNQVPLRGFSKLIPKSIPYAILCTDPCEPKFNFVTNQKILDANYGLNNLFHVVIAFLMHLKCSSDNDMLEGVSLGRAGINILWVIDD